MTLVFPVSYNERVVRRANTAIGSGVLGFVITAAFYVLSLYLLHHETSPGPLDLVSGTANVVLCPPLLLFIWCM
jgi:hypothetical protein